MDLSKRQKTLLEEFIELVNQLAEKAEGKQYIELESDDTFKLIYEEADDCLIKCLNAGLMYHPTVWEWYVSARGLGARELLRRAKRVGADKGCRQPLPMGRPRSIAEEDWDPTELSKEIEECISKGYSRKKIRNILSDKNILPPNFSETRFSELCNELGIEKSK